MFSWLKKQYHTNQIAKYAHLDLFHTRIDVLEVEIGLYGHGLERLADILTKDGTIEERVLYNATVRFNNNDLVVSGVDKETKTIFEKIIELNEISWHRTTHAFGTGLDVDHELCKNPNEGVFDMELNNGESILLGYTLDKTKDRTFIS